MMNIVFQAEKTRPKITAEELESQSSKILPSREELVVMDYSTLNTPYYAAAHTPAPSYQQEYTPYSSYRSDFTAPQYTSQYNPPPVPNNYDWASYGNYYAYGHNPQYDPNCDYYEKGDHRWDNDWSRNDRYDNHDWKNDRVDVDRHRVDNWDNWQYSAYIYPNPQYDGTRIA